MNMHAVFLFKHFYVPALFEGFVNDAPQSELGGLFHVLLLPYTGTL